MLVAFSGLKQIKSAVSGIILLFTCAMLLSGRSYANQENSAPVGQMSFINAQQLLQLQPEDSHYLLQVRENTLKVQLSNRLLIKTGHQYNAASLRLLHPDIQQVQQLAKLQLTNWWLLTVNEQAFHTVLLHLQQHDEVLSVQPDLSLLRQKAMTVESYEKIPQQQSVQQAETVKAVRLAIIDDGFNFNHPEFAAINLAFEYDADQRIQSAAPKSERDKHGTLVAGVIAAAADNHGIDGLLPDIELIAIRQVSSWTSDMVLAFSVARMVGAEVVNSSWVLSFLPEPLLDVITDWMQAQQPYLVFAAGNNRRDACEVNALSELKGIWLIGAADKKGQPLPYSNFGPCVSFYAPARFMSTSATGQDYKAFGGTSAATAYVSGLIARELASGNKPSMELIKTILQSTKSE